MDTKVASVAAAADIQTPGLPANAPATIGGQAPAPQPTGPDPAQMRLVIEEDQSSGSYVYKIIDRQTGKVIEQFPRDEVLRMRDAPAYGAGNLIKTTA